MILLSLREASSLIESQILSKDSKKSNYKLALLQSLNPEEKDIVNYKLEGALVSAKFFAGQENYTKQEEEYLMQQLMNSLKKYK